MNPVPAPAPWPHPRRGEIWWVALDPTRGSEINKTRPCVVLSSDRLGRIPLRTVVPLTGWKEQHEGRWPCVKIEPDGRNGLDKISTADGTQARCVALERFRSKLGSLDSDLLRDVASSVALTIEAA